MEESTLRVIDLDKKYGSVCALDRLSFSLEKGEIFGLIGENGSGKTTALKIIAGILKEDGGDVQVLGHSIKENSRYVKRRVGYVPETFGTYDTLRVQEYLEYYAGAYGMYGLMARRRIGHLLELLRLSGKEQEQVARLSAGMKQRLSIARCLLHDPKLLLLDEPMNGLDPKQRIEFRKIVKQLGQEGKTILLSSHILAEIPDMCNSIGIMENGKLLLKGQIQELLEELEQNNPLVIQLVDEQQIPLAVSLMQPLIFVRTVAVKRREIVLTLSEEEEAERKLLSLLIESNIPVVSFGREKANLENLFQRQMEKGKDRQ